MANGTKSLVCANNLMKTRTTKTKTTDFYLMKTMATKMRKFYHPWKINLKKTKTRLNGNKTTNQETTQTTLTTSMKSWLSTQNSRRLTKKWALLLRWVSLFQRARSTRSSNFSTTELRRMKTVIHTMKLTIFGLQVLETSGASGRPTSCFGLHIT